MMKAFITKVGLFIGSIIIAMIILELFLRIAYTEVGRRSVKYDKDLGWAGIPYAQGVYYFKEDNLHAHYKFNELGCRDELISSLKPGSKRIVLLGDSFVESLEVEYDSTFHRRVENMLKTNISKDIDVVNVSSQNYGTSQEIIALDKYQDIIKPNIVILVFYTGNDFDDNRRIRFASIDKNGKLVFNKQKDSSPKVIYSSIVSWLYDNSHLVFFIRNIIQSNLNLSLFANHSASEKAGDSKDYERKITELLILDLNEKLQAKKIPFGIVIIPHKNEIIEHNSSKPEFIEKLCVQSNIPYLNLYGKLEPADYLKVDEHFNVIGHSVVSPLIYSFIVDHFLSHSNQ